jgi:hypothetical protein
MDAEPLEAANRGNTVFIDDYFQRYVSPMVALREIHELLEFHRPEWYTREVRNLMKSALRQWQWPEV